MTATTQKPSRRFTGVPKKPHTPAARVISPAWAIAGLPKPTLRHGSNFCECGGCGEFFYSDRHFARHREGGVCLTPADMHAKGMTMDERGYWLTKRAAPNL